MPQSHAGSKRRREPFNVDIKLVEIYDDLAHETDEIRLKAAQALVSQFTPDKNPSHDQIQKALRRLFRGICSSRKAARIGFSIALTEVLAQVFASSAKPTDLTITSILDILESQTNAAGSETGQEQRDHHFGRLFGAEAIVKSSILFKPSSAIVEWSRLLDLVFGLAKLKPWIREECGWIIYRCIANLSELGTDVQFVEIALERLCFNNLARTPEGVSIWLAAKDAFPSAAFPVSIWKHDDPLDSKERSQLAKIMKESASPNTSDSDKNGNAKSSSIWSSKLHFAWEALLTRVSDVPIKENSKPKHKRNSSRLTFIDFWAELVDNGLFASSSSEERKYWGFLLLIKVLDDGPITQAAEVFTKNLMRCFVNQLAVEDRYLHRIAVKAEKSIHSRVAREPEFAAISVSGLMGQAGSIAFDQVTKRKTAEKIVAEANLDALKPIVLFLESLIAQPRTDDSKVAAANRQYLAGLLLAIVRAHVLNQGSDDDVEPILESILFIFLRYGYFVAEAKDQYAHPTVTEQTQVLFRSRIHSCLNSIIANQKYAATLPYNLVRKIRSAIKSREFGKPVIDTGDKVYSAVKAAFSSLKKLSSIEKKDKSAGAGALKLLYSLTVLQVYSGDSDAVAMLDELEVCCSKLIESKTSERNEGSDESDALVEILLSFASKPSQLFRRMSEQVFSAFADSVTENGLDSLISILEVKENFSGQQEIFDQTEEGDEDTDIDMISIDENDDDDIEVADGEETRSDHGEKSQLSGSGEDDEDELAAFESKLAAALGTHRGDYDLKEQSSGESDADMNDEEMERLDAQLVNVFKARRQSLNQKKDKKDAKGNMVNFKNRVLDLLEIYVKRCHSKFLALDLILPLLRLTRKSSVQQISGKANSVLREYTRLCKGPALPTLDDVSPAWELLRSIHKEAGQSGPPTHASACSQASLLVVKVLVSHDKGAISEVVDVYGATRKEQFLSKKCRVQPSFFTDWNNWCTSASRQMKN